MAESVGLEVLPLCGGGSIFVLYPVWLVVALVMSFA